MPSYIEKDRKTAKENNPSPHAFSFSSLAPRATPLSSPLTPRTQPLPISPNPSQPTRPPLTALGLEYRAGVQSAADRH